MLDLELKFSKEDSDNIKGNFVRTVQYLNELVKFKSYSYNEKEIIDFIEDSIRKIGKIDKKGYVFEMNRVDNILLVDVNFGHDNYICLVGHVDIVNEGDISKRDSNPFELKVEKRTNNIDSIFIGRGVSDMKGFIAIMLSLLELVKYVRPKYNLKFIFYDREENAEITGIEDLVYRNDNYYKDFIKDNDIIIIGEPTSLEVHYGVYGYIGGYLTLKGKQGHSSKINIYDSVYNNFNRLFLELGELQDKFKDNIIVSLTSLNVENSSLNTVPGNLSIGINIRYNPFKIDDIQKEKIINGLFKKYNFRKSQIVDGYISKLDKIKSFLGDDKRYEIASYRSDLAIIGNKLKFNRIVNWGPGRIEEAHSYNEKLYGVDLIKYISDLYELLFLSNDKKNPK